MKWPRRAWIVSLLASLACPAAARADGDSSIGLTLADPSSAEAIPTHVDGPWWQDGAAPRWLVESSLSPGIASSGPLFVSAGTQAEIGAIGSVGFRYVRAWRHHRALNANHDLIPALMWLTVGLIALPVDTWLGNEQGLDLRVRGIGSPDAGFQRWAVSVGIAPVFRISPNRSRVRFPSIVGALLPEIGVSFGERQTAAYFSWSLFPFSVVLVPHLGMELHIEQGVWVPFDGSAVRVFAGVRLGMVLR